MNNNEQIGKTVREWLYQNRITQVEAAKHLEVNQSSVSQMLCARIPFPVDKLKVLIDWLTPPQEEVTNVLRLHFLQKGKNKKHSELSPLVKVGLHAEAERLKMLYSHEDGLFIEFHKLWKDFDMTEKLQILSLANEIKKSETNED